MVLEAAARRGVPAAAVLRGTDLRPEQLDSPELRVPARDAARLIGNAIAQTSDPGLGLEIGLQMKPTSHGNLGSAAMTCRTLGEAIDLVARYWRLQLRDVALRVFADGPQVVLELRESQPLGPFRQLFLEWVTTALYQMGMTILVNHSPAPEAEIWFDWPEPDYFGRYRSRLPSVRFEMPSVQLRFAAAYLEQPLRLADTATARRSVERCERDLRLLELEAVDVVERVRIALVPGSDGFPDLDSVATGLGMSGRTLKRKLHERGYRFRSLLDDARLREARRLLMNPEIEIGQIAELLGYSDAAGFNRAFRRWSGETPSQARERLSDRKGA